MDLNYKRSHNLFLIQNNISLTDLSIIIKSGFEDFQQILTKNRTQ